MNSYIANKRSQDLAQHCVLVGRLARALVQQGFSRRALELRAHSTQDHLVTQAADVAYMAGLLHDIGKIDGLFQSHITSVAGEPPFEATPDDCQIDAKFKPSSKAVAFSFDKYPCHEEVSWLLLQLFVDGSKGSKLGLRDDLVHGHASRRAIMEYAVYWHHPNPLRNSEVHEELFSSVAKLCDRVEAGNPDKLNALHADLTALFKQIDTLAPDAGLSATILPSHLVKRSREATPDFKTGYQASFLTDYTRLSSALDNESLRTLVRAAVVSADRMVSQLSALELETFVRTDTLPAFSLEQPVPELYAQQLQAVAERFDTALVSARTTGQAVAAKELALRTQAAGIACLQGPAGCGKTVIALRWLLQAGATPRRTYIFVPRTAIGEGLFHELTTEYGITADVELLTGASKKFWRAGASASEETSEQMQNTGSIVITTIDQLCKVLLSHKDIDFALELTHCNVIFDEFHELADLAGITVLFAELMRLRQLSVGGTLLVSATPNPFFLKVLNVPPAAVTKVATHNLKPFEFIRKELPSEDYGKGTHVFARPVDLNATPGSIVVSNTATLAQQAALEHLQAQLPAICFHSKFTPEQKAQLLQTIMARYGTGSTGTQEVLISGPIVQASLNISTAQLHTEVCSAENFLQRIGRVNRFAQLPHAQVLYYIAPSNKGGLANASILGGLQQYHRTLHLANRLTVAMGANATWTLPMLYDWYEQFHKEPATEQAYIQDFNLVLVATTALFKTRAFDPVRFPPETTVLQKKGGQLARKSLRGRSFYVLPVKVTLLPNGGVLKSLLWHSQSSDSQLLTDELRGMDDFIKTWTQKASSPSVTSNDLRQDPEVVTLLSSMEKATKGLKTWEQVKLKALKRESPVLVSKGSFDEDGMYYVQIGSTPIGLVSAKRFQSFLAPLLV